MKLRETSDGSKTLQQESMDVCYHSVHGAWTETQHVFGEMGVMPALSRHEEDVVHVLEVGFGTGLNVLDVWLRAKAAGRHVAVRSLEPHPLTWEEVASLNYAEATGVPEEVWRGHARAGAMARRVDHV